MTRGVVPGTNDAIPLSIPATIAASPNKRIRLFLNTQLIPAYHALKTLCETSATWNKKVSEPKPPMI